LLDHPRTVYLRQADLLPHLDGWLTGLFDSPTSMPPSTRSRAVVVCIGDGEWPVRPTVVLVGPSLGGLQRRLGVLGPSLGRPGASSLGRDHRGPVPLGILHGGRAH
jgi:hypothetical protein